MYVVDASSIIHAWDNYPLEQFPPVWNWLQEKFSEQELVLPETALEEVEHNSPECHTWFKENEISPVEVTEEMLLKANEIKVLLEVEEDKYGGGVDEYDLIVIACAFVNGGSVISNEALQPDLPNTKKKNYKMPAVCSLSEVNVECIDFITLVKNSGAVFK